MHGRVPFGAKAFEVLYNNNTLCRQQLRQLQHYTGQLAKDTATQLKQLQELQPPGDQGAKMQRERLQDQFTKALDNFQNIQREAADKERQKLKAAQYDQEVALPGPGEGFGGQQSRTQMMLEEEDRLKELEDRERAMRQLESDIGDVNEIFKDLATLVHDQGEIIDSIESNIETTAVHVETGAEQLRQVGAGPQPSVHYLYSVLTGSSLSKQSKEEEDNSGSCWNYNFRYVQNTSKLPI